MLASGRSARSASNGCAAGASSPRPRRSSGGQIGLLLRRWQMSHGSERPADAETRPRTNRDAVGLRALLTGRYERLDAISENRWRWRDTSRARALFGYQ